MYVPSGSFFGVLFNMDDCLLVPSTLRGMSYRRYGKLFDGIGTRAIIYSHCCYVVCLAWISPKLNKTSTAKTVVRVHYVHAEIRMAWVKIKWILFAIFSSKRVILPWKGIRGIAFCHNVCVTGKGIVSHLQSVGTYVRLAFHTQKKWVSLPTKKLHRVSLPTKKCVGLSFRLKRNPFDK